MKMQQKLAQRALVLALVGGTLLGGVNAVYGAQRKVTLVPWSKLVAVPVDDGTTAYCIPNSDFCVVDVPTPVCGPTGAVKNGVPPTGKVQIKSTATPKTVIEVRVTDVVKPPVTPDDPPPTVKPNDPPPPKQDPTAAPTAAPTTAPTERPKGNEGIGNGPDPQSPGCVGNTGPGCALDDVKRGHGPKPKK